MRLSALSIFLTILIGSVPARAEESGLPSELSELRQQLKQLQSRVAELERQLRNTQRAAGTIRWDGPAAPTTAYEVVPPVPDGTLTPATPRDPLQFAPIRRLLLARPAVYGGGRVPRYWEGIDAGMKADALQREGKLPPPVSSR